METLFKRYLKGDKILWVVFLALCILSIIEMYSASSTLAYKSSNHAMPVIRHVGFLTGGVIIAFIVHMIPYRWIRIVSYLGLALSAVLLVFVLFKGHSENDAARWLVIGGVQFQPSELAKLSVIIVAADLISRIRDNTKDEWIYFRNTIIMLIAICGLILLENFSTAAILFIVVFIMMFIGRISFKYLGSIAAILIVCMVLGFVAVKALPENSLGPFKRAKTWVARIERHSDKGAKESKYVITDKNRQEIYGQIAIARGGVFGVFPGNSVERDYLPQAYSDFIYSIIVEEMGLIGGIGVIILYLILLFRAGRIVMNCSSVFPAILVMGLSLMIVLQTFINMSVATSLIPVTGQPLPLISRGGTSILITCIYFGIILGITRQIVADDQPNGSFLKEEEEQLPVVELESL
ncbi:MAG: FtsW/RodA/SpoVE family cell cycle protein [Paludibacter sp.]|jgi:cell division protein FtsW